MNVLVSSSLQPAINKAGVAEVKKEIEKTFKSLRGKTSLSVPRLRAKKSTRELILLKAAETMLELT